jgi:hypothetical protein
MPPNNKDGAASVLRETNWPRIVLLPLGYGQPKANCKKDP